MILVTIDVMNMSVGMKRDIGIACASKDLRRIKKVLHAVVVCVSAVFALTAIIIGIPNFGVVNALGIGTQYILIIIVMLYSMALQQVFSEALVALMRSKDTMLPLLVGSIARIPILLVIIAFFDRTEFGVVIAYSSMLVISTPLLAIYLIKSIRGSLEMVSGTGVSVRQLLKSSMAGWVPQIIRVLGSQLGVVAIFAIGGALEAGRFYVPMSIFLVALFIVTGINRVSHSLIAGLSSMEAQKSYFIYFTRMAFMFTMPITTPLVFFAGDFLSLIGDEFNVSATALIILMLSLPVVIVSEMLYYFAYGRGDNKLVLYLGLVGNIPRTILYFVLVPILGVNGAALAYVIGSISQAMLSVKFIRSYELRLQYKKYVLLTLIPLAIGSLVWILHINYIISSAIMLIGSSFVYVKIGLFTQNELRNIIFASLPQRVAESIFPRLSSILQKVMGN
jgi:O-antigen/teichoic acid export membrane protein